MNEIYYVMKDGHCLDKFDNEENAIRYAKKVGGIVTEYTNKYSNYYETNICENLSC